MHIQENELNFKDENSPPLAVDQNDWLQIVPSLQEDTLDDDDEEEDYLLDNFQSIIEEEEAYFHCNTTRAGSKKNRKYGRGRHGKVRFWSNVERVLTGKKRSMKNSSRSKQNRNGTMRKRIAMRREMESELLLARKQKNQYLCDQMSGDRCQEEYNTSYMQLDSFPSQLSSRTITNHSAAQNYPVLPMESLGIEDGSMYDRLLSILNGDDITPEDYDLLLQLDKNNIKKTMSETEISELPSFACNTASENGTYGLLDGTSDDSCKICLEKFTSLAAGTEIRRLPCGHMFCKDCIDHWFREVSTKCPMLECFWCTDAKE